MKHLAVEPISAHSILNAVSTGDRKRLVERRRGLSAAALAVANREVRSAYSPIVIAGVMRLIDFGLISLSGVALLFTGQPPSGIRGTVFF